jgi:NADH-quinone oxidoreductase subunit N
MWLLEQADAAAALPEVVLAVLAMALLMFGVFRKNDATDAVTIGALISLGLVATLVILGGPDEAEAFHGALLVDTFARVMKVLALFGSAVALALSASFMKRDGSQRFEYPVLILLATVGMMVMISANNRASLRSLTPCSTGSRILWGSLGV